MQRYCAICEKKVETMYILIEHGTKYAVGACGHNTRIEEKKVDSPTFIMNMSGTHNAEYGKYGRK